MTANSISDTRQLPVGQRKTIWSYSRLCKIVCTGAALSIPLANHNGQIFTSTNLQPLWSLVEIAQG
jgi:hypothetical protein